MIFFVSAKIKFFTCSPRRLQTLTEKSQCVFLVQGIISVMIHTALNKVLIGVLKNEIASISQYGSEVTQILLKIPLQ